MDVDADDDQGRAEDAEADADERSRDEQLDGLRIRQHTALRRGAYRARSYAIIGVAGCAFAAVLLVLIAVAHAVAARRPTAISIGCAIGATAATSLARYFARRVRRLNAEIATPAPLPPAPADGPDFSTLSDGSQRWKNLEDIR